MKNLVACTAFLFAFFWANAGLAQSLQFSRVVLVTNLQTVPAGKIWKVESAMLTGNLGINTGTTSYQAQSAIIRVDGQNINLMHTFGNSYGVQFQELSRLPMWLPSGTTLEPSTNIGKISIIEFTVVP